MPGFNAPKDRLTLVPGASAAGDFKLKPVLTHHSDHPKVLKNHARSALPELRKWNDEPDGSASVYDVVY